MNIGISLFNDFVVYGLGYGFMLFLIGFTCGNLLKYFLTV